MKFDVTIDVTMGMSVTIEASSEEEAERIIKEKHYVPTDLRNSWHVGNKVVDIIEAEE